MMCQRAVFDLQRAKAELQRSTNDFEGHRESAITACDTALVELQAVMKSAGPQQPMMQRPQMPAPPPQQSPPPVPMPSPTPVPPPPAQQ